MKITEHTHALKIPFCLKRPDGNIINRFVYVYLIFSNGITIIDSGVYGCERIIFDYILSQGSDIADIKKLILTHSHPDHIGAAKAIKTASNCSVIAHNNAKKWTEDIDLQFKERPVPDFYSITKESVKIDIIVKDNEIIKLSKNLNLKVLYLPGHASDQVGFYLIEEKTLFSSDAIILKNSMPIYEDLQKTKDSIMKIKDISDMKLLLSAWDDPRDGESISKTINDSITYLDKIKNVIDSSLDIDREKPPLEFCKIIIKKLNLPDEFINPLVASSFTGGTLHN